MECRDHSLALRFFSDRRKSHPLSALVLALVLVCSAIGALELCATAMSLSLLLFPGSSPRLASCSLDTSISHRTTPLMKLDSLADRCLQAAALEPMPVYCTVRCINMYSLFGPAPAPAPAPIDLVHARFTSGYDSLQPSFSCNRLCNRRILCTVLVYFKLCYL